MGQLAYDRERLFPRRCTVPQVDSFFVGYNAAAEGEVKEIKRHGRLPP
jgi:hypothetical protein